MPGIVVLVFVLFFVSSLPSLSAPIFFVCLSVSLCLSLSLSLSLSAYFTMFFAVCV